MRCSLIPVCSRDPNAVRTQNQLGEVVLNPIKLLLKNLSGNSN